MKPYDHSQIEQKWQNVWKDSGIYATADKADGKDNFYLLVEFPYPSGNLHVGHWYAFAEPDILARYYRAQGKNVLYPIGFDAFGLPAENAAIKNKLNPREWTYGNIDYMKKQIESMGTSFDWSRQVTTCDPEYYKWTQWLFLQLYNKGLVYQKETAVNWCPKDKTVLANEQVVSGKCERCDSDVVQKLMLQWNIKITEYADRLIDDLAELDWPEQIKESQRNWIGRSEGAEIDFALDLGEKYTYVILHGYKSRPDRPRWLWVKAELEKLGHTVIIPELPNPDEPTEEEWVTTALAATEYDEKTVLVGHSLGAVAAMKALQKLDRKIARLVLIDPAIDPSYGEGSGEPKPFWKTFDWDINYEKLAKLALDRLVLSDLQETRRVPYLKQLAPKLNARLVQTNAVTPHFTGDKEPDVLMWLRPTIRVFTTRPDTLFGATYLVLAPEHPWVTLALGHKTVLMNNAEVQKYVTASSKKTELERQTDQKDKTGVRLEGVMAVNPATGEKIPMYVADYVLGHYGTGAIMAVPAHDERDFEFATKFGLPIKQVIEPVFVGQRDDDKPRDGMEMFDKPAIAAVVKHWSDDTYLMLDWKKVDWHTIITGGIDGDESAETAARREILEETGFKNIRLIRALPNTHSKFFHTPKNRNQFAHFQSFYFELIDGEKEEVTADEQANHDTRWVSLEELKQTITPRGQRWLLESLDGDAVFTDDGLLGNSGDFSGQESAPARIAMTEAFGRAKKTYKLRDWIVSRQRYWGVPIPMVHCDTCGAQPVPDEQLPVVLPEIDDYLPEGEGKSPLAKATEWVSTKCPKCGGTARRETDTLDTFVDSSWYFVRYADPKNGEQFADMAKQKSWLPVDLYSGGAEHTTMHLLYSRFWHKALFDCGLVADPEPYKRRMNRSLIMGPDGQKMSKSRGNVIDPDEVVRQLGADTVRLYLAFIGPYNEVANYPWNPNGVVGVRRFLERVWKLAENLGDNPDVQVESALHRTIRKVGDDIEKMKFNTAISTLMIFVNDVDKNALSKDQYARLVQLVAPFAPHMAEELWHDVLGKTTSIHAESWPTFDASLAKEERVTIAIQVNGKTRATVEVESDADDAALEAAGRQAVTDRLASSNIKRVVVVKGRLVNFVLED